MKNNLYFLFAGMAAVTYLTRMPPLWLGSKVDLSPRLKRGLSFMPVGVFAAMTIVPVLTHHGTHQFNLYLPAALVATLVAAVTKKPFWSMISGMALVALLRLVLG